jgi:hypothetical protein
MGAPGVPFYIAHEPAGTGGANDLLKKNSPFGAGRAQMVLENNALWLEQINPCRPLASHPGFFGINDPGLNGYAFLNPPQWTDLNWNTAQTKGSLVGNACLGYHYTWKYYNTGQFPQLAITARRRINAPGYFAYYIGVSPGTQAFAASSAIASAVIHDPSGSSTFSDFAAVIPLNGILPNTGDAFAMAPYASGTGPFGPGESGTLVTFSVYLATAVTSGATADLIGISAFLIPPLVSP